MRLRCILLLVLVASPALAASSRGYRQAALGAAQWLEWNAVRTPQGEVWAADPRQPQSVNSTLYAGTPGVVLFFLEAYRYTREPLYLEQARLGADSLVAALDNEKDTGLYEGLAGIGFTLGEAWIVSGDQKYRAAALHVVELLQQRAHKVGAGVEWNDTTDVIAGASGTGLFLLWADRGLHAPGARELAVAAGRRLIERAEMPAPDQFKWMMDSKFPREMPNFSHGTAGVAYFLATLYLRTRGPEFLDAALAGARYLLSIADKQGDACIIYHDDTFDGKKLYYLGWCHGPAGTARLFYRLYEATRDPEWLAWVRKSARAAMVRGAPDKAVSPGEWNNVSVCCGTAAEAQFFFDVYQLTHDRQYLRLARKASDRLLAAATHDAGGTRWVQAENRVKPGETAAQTGYMQGAAGIGMWLLHLDSALHGERKSVITLPDNPFTY